MPETAARAFRLEPYDYAEVRALMDALDLAEPVAVTLVRRGHRTVADARAFLEAADDHDPFLFEGMAGVCERIRAAIADRRRITVHGDYDVDGVCSTSILVETLRAVGAECDWLIPGRLEDGYGLTIATVEKLRARGTGLLLTADCGIGSVAEIAAVRAAGIEPIVTDHHQPGDELPDCPILHPSVSGYPCTELCATGVAYKLAVALRGRQATYAQLDLVALATVADLVPLRGENRALVRRGLAEARRARRPGLRALLASARCLPERLDEGDLAFRLAPRINAAGRLYRADAGVELMLTDDEGRAEEIATELERANSERRAVEAEVLEAAGRAFAELPPELAEAPGLVLAGAGWHPGVVGIVASRMVERHGRPVVLVALDGEGRGRGSGRSVPGFDLLGALDASAEHLVRYGGHRAAAGLEVEAGRLEDFRQAFAAHAREVLGDAPPVRTELVDAIVGGESLGHDVAEQFERLAPFGNGNPGIRLLVPGANVSDVRPMGEGERHARFTLASGASRALGVAFSVNGELDAAARSGPLDVSVKLELNEWNGAVEPRVVLGQLYPREDPAPGQHGEPGEAEFWRRVREQLLLDLAIWPPPPRPAAGRRELVDRRGASGVATIAALASSGGAVLVMCADALRRRELVERAARPARFGGGELAIVCGRLADSHCAGAEARVRARGGVVLADWAALARDPALASRFEHVVLVDPPPFAHLAEACAGGDGYVHSLAGLAEVDFALRVHADEWPSRASLAELYRALGPGGNGGACLDGDAARTLLRGERRAHPRSPECAGRALRVLVELGLVRIEGDPAVAPALGVVSSSGTELEKSPAFVAYRDRYEEGKRYLNEQRQK